MDRPLPSSVSREESTAAAAAVATRLEATSTATAAAAMTTGEAAARRGSRAMHSSTLAPPQPDLPPRESFHLTEDERQAMLQVMLRNSELNPETGEDQLKRGAASMIAKHFGVRRESVSRLWKQAAETRKEHPLGIANVSIRRKGRSGAKPRMSRHDFEALVEGLPYDERSTIVDIAKHAGLTKAAAHRYAKLYLVRVKLDED